MSEFSESYHLRSRDTADTVALLRRAGVDGFVFPSAEGWTAFVAEGGTFAPDERLVAAAPAPLLHYVCAEDHGWSFALFAAGACRSAYQCSWDEQVQVHDDDCVPEVLVPYFAPDYPQPRETLARLLRPATLNEIFEYNPAYTFAAVLGLRNYAWTAYDTVARDVADGHSPDPGLITVTHRPG